MVTTCVYFRSSTTSVAMLGFTTIAITTFLLLAVSAL
jgi:hypothetical protein